MKYVEEYNITNNKNAFIQLLLSKYPHLKRATALRRYYDVRKYSGVKKEVVQKYVPEYTPDILSIPNYHKMIMLEDMKRLRTKLTRRTLKRFGFFEYEINWLIKNNKVERIS